MLMTLELPETSVPAARRPVLQSRRDLINPPEHRSHLAHTIDRALESRRVESQNYNFKPVLPRAVEATVTDNLTLP